ncbi:unnamed protein product [Dicrocoelium dendriticum]|nr:unnamed protein product [Dicrocoelium dendriticum]
MIPHSELFISPYNLFLWNFTLLSSLVQLCLHTPISYLHAILHPLFNTYDAQRHRRQAQNFSSMVRGRPTAVTKNGAKTTVTPDHAAHSDSPSSSSILATVFMLFYPSSKLTGPLVHARLSSD